MPLTSGSKLGSYEIVAPLGAGGMGEVYRARDAKLGRDVAIKVLPESFAQDPERVARFQREAQLLATLNHPHIAGIYGLEESADMRYLVLELVEGQPLSGTLLPVEEALTIARQIVDALEAAHDKGIVHRDLKPANIMLTHDGQVKVLDFGLAKQETATAGSPGGMSHSPTLTFAATQAGVILGTAAYMSPEQAKGRIADKRSDVWAFGCVLFELLTGRRAFDGEDVSDTLASILRGEPDWAVLPPAVPPHIVALLKRCLAKDRKARIPDLSVVRFMLDEPMPAPATGDARAEGNRPVNSTTLRVWQVATALLAIALGAGAAWYASHSTSRPTTRFGISPPQKWLFVVNGREAAAAAISPDGLKLAFTARDAAGKILLWIRPLNALAAQPMVGTEGASYPFWSPDSRFVAYSTPGKLMKVAASGGVPETVCAFSAAGVIGRGGAWNRENLILFNTGAGQPIFRVAASGGQPSPAWPLPRDQSGQQFPSFLPDGRHVLYYASSTSREVSGLHVASIDSGESKRIAGSDTGGVYVTESARLLFVRQGTLFSQSFDAKALALSGEPVSIAESVESGVIAGIVAFSASDAGVLAYGIGLSASASMTMAWFDRQGKLIETVGPAARYEGIALSPDDRHVAAHRHEGMGGDIWVTDVTRTTTSRFTFEPSFDDQSPIWSPDGSMIAFASFRNGKFGLYRKPANNGGVEERLYEDDGIGLRAVSWTPDGGSIVFQRLDPKTRQDLWILSLSGERKAVPFLVTPFNENHAQISTDGKWTAYASNDTGLAQVYVQPYPAGAGKWQVSTTAGNYPKWRRDGRELYYISATGELMAVDVKVNGASFDGGPPRRLFDSGVVFLTGGGGTHPFVPYAVSADGQRFLITRPTLNDADGPPQIVVVTNWTDGLKK